MPQNKKGQPESRPHPQKVVCHDTAESKASPHVLQVSRLRRYAVNSAMAEAIAPLVFLEALR